MNKAYNDEMFSLWLDESEVVVANDPLLKALDELLTAGPSLELLQNARAKLRQSLSDKDENVVYYDHISHPLLGIIFAAVTEDGLFALDFDISETEFIERIELDWAQIANRQKTGGKIAIRSIARVKPILTQVNDYLNGNRHIFDLSLDLAHISEFQRKVLMATRQVPYGQVVTYADIARKIGKSQAARAVGQALRRNPIPLIIPCHRVIASDGSLRGYKGKVGLEKKATLLNLEGYQLSL
jgi:O-6-methylguanine DNA methyltransferase